MAMVYDWVCECGFEYAKNRSVQIRNSNSFKMYGVTVQTPKFATFLR